MTAVTSCEYNGLANCVPRPGQRLAHRLDSLLRLQSLKQFPIILINLSSPLFLSYDSLNEAALLQLVEVCNAEKRSLLLLHPVQV